jgi:hypothetical protein
MALPLLMILPLSFVSSPSKADWSSTSSTQLILGVNAAKGVAKASSADYAITGSGLNVANLNTAGTASLANVTYTPTSAGAAFNLQMSQKVADTVVVTDIDAGNLPAYSNVTIDTDGTALTLSGTITSPTVGTAKAGGPGSTATLTQTNVYSVF